MFDLQLDRVREWIRNNGFRTVALQFPEGMRSEALAVSDALAADGVSAVIIGDPCYGACDIRKDSADALVHFGHSRIPSQDDGGNVLYVEARARTGMGTFDASVLPGNVGLLATVQYVGLIPRAKEILESQGINVLVGRGDGRTAYDGQVLGCNCTSARSVEEDVDAFLFIGEGDFHPLAAALGVRKDVFVIDPMTSEIRSMAEKRDRMLRRRFAAIESSRDAGSFLIVVSSKAGQRRDGAAEAAERRIRAAGRKAYTAVMDEISPERLMHYDVDVLVNTACPRIAMDDSARYGRPMLTLPELDIALGYRDWEEYEFDQIREDVSTGGGPQGPPQL